MKLFAICPFCKNRVWRFRDHYCPLDPNVAEATLGNEGVLPPEEMTRATLPVTPVMAWWFGLPQKAIKLTDWMTFKSAAKEKPVNYIPGKYAEATIEGLKLACSIVSEAIANNPEITALEISEQIRLRLEREVALAAKEAEV